MVKACFCFGLVQVGTAKSKKKGSVRYDNVSVSVAVGRAHPDLGAGRPIVRDCCRRSIICERGGR